MELSYDNPIYADSIYYVKELKEVKVFMLNGYGTDRVVIKHEDGRFTDQDVAWHSKIMGSIDPGAKAKALTAAELTELSNYVNGSIALHDFIAGASALKTTLGLAQGRTWIKMKAHKLLALDDATKKTGTGDKTDVRIVAAALNGPDGLEKLGRVIAADFFIGNTDRFVWPGPGGPSPEPNSKTLKCLVNVGNVFSTIDPSQNKAQISGLDFLDPSSTTKSAVGNVNLGEWMGIYLSKAKKTERMRFCHDAVSDLNYCLGPRSRKAFFLSKKRLESDAANRLNTGMEQGAYLIMSRIQFWKKTHTAALPTGIGARTTKLGWTI